MSFFRENSSSKSLVDLLVVAVRTNAPMGKFHVPVLVVQEPIPAAFHRLMNVGISVS